MFHLFLQIFLFYKIYILKTINNLYSKDATKLNFCRSLCINNSQIQYLYSDIASLVPSNREQLWQYLCGLKHSVPPFWMAIGDFNDIPAPSEIKGVSFILEELINL